MIIDGGTLPGVDDSWERRFGITPWEPEFMTICIAAICERGRGIVICADRELGLPHTSAEFDDGKWHSLCQQWSIGISGTVSNACSVMMHASEMVPDLEGNNAIDLHGLLGKAYRRARMTVAEARFLGNRGWTLDQFQKVGVVQLPISTYSTIDAQISTFDFNTDLIAAGFGSDDAGASILTVTNPGVCIDHSKLGFWGVGSGWIAAQMSLFAREYSWSFSAEKAAFLVYEAKVAAEHATGVGKTTDIYLLRPGKEELQTIPLQSETIKALENIRAEIAPREYSSDHHKMLQNMNEFAIFRQSA